MKILCASWHYPPSSEIAGKVVYRFVRTLVRRGHEVTVVTVPASAAGVIDASATPDIPGLHIVRVEPWPDIVAGLARWKNSLRGASTARSAAGGASAAPAVRAVPLRRRVVEMRNIPDRANGWIMPARRALRALVRNNRPDVMISVSPFFSAHLAALGVHRTFPDLAWWAWSHDPASGNPYDAGAVPAREACLRRWEATVMREATGICVCTEPVAEEFERRYARHPIVVACGFDPADVPAASVPRADGPMVMTHAGTLYGHRSPVPLLEAIATLRRASRVSPDTLRFRLIGDATDLLGESPQRAVARLDLADMVSVEPPVSQVEALRALQASHVGVVLAEGQPLQIPAKTFEYAGLGLPILAFAEGATASLVEDNGLGVVATRATASEAIATLVAQFQADGLQALREQIVRAQPLLTMDHQVDGFERAVADQREQVAAR